MTRLFNLDFQLLHDTILMAISVFVLFTVMSYNLFEPVRKMLKGRQEKIKTELESAASDQAEAAELRQQYEEKLKAANKEAELILSDARKTAVHNEQKIIDEAKEEAARIIERANKEAELEKQKAADDVKQQIVAVSAMIASKLIAKSIDESESNAIIEQTLNEMGENTWRN